MFRKEDPGGQQKPLPGAHRVQAPRQNSEVPRVEPSAPRQQFHRQEEEAVRKHKASQAGTPRLVYRPQGESLQAYKPQTKKRGLRLYLDFVLKTSRVVGVWVWRVGRSALRPDLVSRACRVDRPPALFSQAEENLRPLEPVFASSTGEGSGSGSRNPSLTPGGRDGQA